MDKIESRVVDEEAEESKQPEQVVGSENQKRKSRQESGASIKFQEGRAGEYASRELRITDRFLNKYGFTTGCEGCEFKLADRDSHRAHTQQCQQWIYDAMLKDERDAEALEKVRRRLEGRHKREVEKEFDNMTTDSAAGCAQNC